jgi:recombination protein RecA
MSEINQIKKSLMKDKTEKRISSADFVSTGSTLLNLACTGKSSRGFMKGKFYYLVGDSRSGKTFLTLTCLAEAAQNKNFDNYRFIYDNAEDGALMNIRHFFGSKVDERMEPPSTDDAGEPVYSETIEEFYYNVDDAVKAGKPFIYILDSMDALTSDSERSKFKDQKLAYRKGKDTPGSYGDGKAKKNSSGVRQLIGHLRRTGSILLVVGQTRDNIGGMGFETRTRSGGRALRFYATIEIWSKCGKSIKKTVKDKPRKIGLTSILEVKKNRVSGKDRTVEVPIYNSIGFDDIGGCVDWLIEEGHWKKAKQSLVVPELDFTGTREALIRKIESDGLEKDLRMIVQEAWDEIEEACDPGRKRRYE